MNVLHASVTHNVFGTGKITRQEEAILTVQFQKPHGVRRFLYPDVFLNHLTLCDVSLLSEMEQELRLHRMLIKGEQNRVDRAGKMARCRADSASKAKKAPRR